MPLPVLRTGVLKLGLLLGHAVLCQTHTYTHSCTYTLTPPPSMPLPALRTGVLKLGLLLGDAVLC